jgi:uncharacterized protein with von Willebrand factor type A (vWA) domain
MPTRVSKTVMAVGDSGMEMTLDDYLREVDRWKDAVTERMATLSVDERLREGQEATRRLEMKLGRPLRKRTLAEERARRMDPSKY